MRYIISALLASTATAAFAEVPVVVTDIPPVHSLTAAVMKGVGTPVLLLERGASEHGYQLRPSQAGAVADAGLVVWIGPDLTPWLQAALDNRPEGAETLTLLQDEGTYVQVYGAGEAHDHDADHHDEVPEAVPAEEHEEGHDEDHADGHEDDHADGHDHDGTDPHAWLDPANGRLWVGLIAARLSSLDPDNAALYAANAASAIAAIDAADAQAADLLEPVKAVPFVAFHDAYGYFVGHYGLTMAGTVSFGDASAPGAQHLAELDDLVKSGGVVCLFPEANHDPALVAQLADGAGVRVGGPLDPAAVTGEPGPDLYPALLTGLAGTLAACLNG